MENEIFFFYFLISFFHWFIHSLISLIISTHLFIINLSEFIQLFVLSSISTYITNL